MLRNFCNVHGSARSLRCRCHCSPPPSARSPQKKDFEPQVGQEGKDVIWVPTPQGLVDKMLDMAKVTSSDYVIDLGSGDGRTVITAAKRGARAQGIEYNPDMVELSKKNAEKAGVSRQSQVIEGRHFRERFLAGHRDHHVPAADAQSKLRPKILDLKPGTRIVSHAFTMDDWTADQTDTLTAAPPICGSCRQRSKAPGSSVQGELSLKQMYQMVTGSLKNGAGTIPVNGKLRGDQLTLTAGNAEYTGRVDGNKIEGTVKGSSSGSWTATRAGAKTPAMAK